MHTLRNIKTFISLFPSDLVLPYIQNSLSALSPTTLLETKQRFQVSNRKEQTITSYLLVTRKRKCRHQSQRVLIVFIIERANGFHGGMEQKVTPLEQESV